MPGRMNPRPGLGAGAWGAIGTPAVGLIFGLDIGPITGFGAGASVAVSAAGPETPAGAGWYWGEEKFRDMTFLTEFRRCRT